MNELIYWIYLFFSWFFVIGSGLPSVKNKRWTFRIFDYVRIQSIMLLLGCLFTGIFLGLNSWTVALTEIAIVFSLIHQIAIVWPYVPFQSKNASSGNDSNSIHVISVNVYQYNEDYKALVDLVKTQQPDILLTMESDQKWEDGMKELDVVFSHSVKIPLNNTYGMHLLTNLKLVSTQTHYFIAEDRPAIFAQLEDASGHQFQFWGVHPPPPSPTEEPTSKPKDGDLMCVAKEIANSDLPALVVGDFNTVCWSSSSKLFAKAACLNDARKGFGIKGTFPTKPWALRFPIDLLFYSDGIEVNDLETLQDIGSDHLPLSARVTIFSESMVDVGLDQSLEPRIEAIIQEGEMEHKMNQKR